MSQSTEKVISSYYEGWKTGNLDSLANALDSNFSFQGPMEQHDTKEGFVKSIKAMATQEVFKGMRLNVRNTVIAGENGVVLYDCEFASSGRSVPMAEYFQVANGKIQAIRLYYDPAKFQG